MSIEKFTLDATANEFISKQKMKKQTGLNPQNHNTETKRYAKLSISLTKDEKEMIEKFRAKNYKRYSISSMIIEILEDAKVFETKNH